MMSDSTLRLERLTLQEFRCFTDCTIELHPQLTVLVAENGHGKTAILDAIAVALSLFVDTILDARQRVDIESSDVRRIWTQDVMATAQQAKLIAEGYIAGRPINWSRTRKHDRRRSPSLTKETKNLIQVARDIRERVEDRSNDSVILPLAVFYGTDRFLGKIELSRTEMFYGDTERMDGYFKCLSSPPSLNGIVTWYESKWREAGDPRFATTRAQIVSVISAVQEATQTVLKPTGWSNLTWEQDHLLVVHPDKGTLPPSFLSDGVRTILALVMDIVRRCFTLNPHLNGHAAQHTPGVLLIDEVDMHLHPRWQQLILQSLKAAFPLIQFVVTTHSPQVITTVPAESIRIVRDNSIYAAPPGTDGAEAQRVLEDVFQVAPRPNTEMSLDLDEYLRLVDARQWDSPRALELRQKLDAWSQGQEPRLVEADLQIENIRWEEGR